MLRIRMDNSRRMLGMLLLACTMLWISMTMSGQESSSSNPSSLRDNRQSGKGVAHRRLQDTAAVAVGLYLAVQYLNESVASQLETKDPSNEVVSHFCKSVNNQVCDLERRRNIMLEPSLVVECAAYLEMNRSGLDLYIERSRAHMPFVIFLFVGRQVEAK
jgi:hypothetical protein